MRKSCIPRGIPLDPPPWKENGDEQKMIRVIEARGKENQPGVDPLDPPHGMVMEITKKSDRVGWGGHLLQRET